MTKGISNKIPASSVQKFPLKKTMLAACVAAAFQPIAQAQETEATQVEGLEEVTVYGVRASLKTAQDLKRSADTHVDAISATDIGALPDVSVVEALQRVPGVSIERFAAADDTDHFTSEGASVSLRGLPYTRSEFNGRDSFSADSNRGLSFQDVPPINLNTRKPFDSDGRQVSFEVNGNYGSLEEELTAGFSGVYSDRFDVSGGDLDFRTDGVEFGRQTLIEGVAGAGQDRFVPTSAGIRSLSTERTREGGSAVLQFQNTLKAELIGLSERSSLMMHHQTVQVQAQTLRLMKSRLLAVR